MHRFHNILLVYEADRSTLARAAALAKKHQATLAVVQVVGELPPRLKRLKVGGESVDLQTVVLKEFEKRLGQFVRPAKKKGIHITTAVLVGREFEEIIRDVLRHGRDLVIMAAEGSGRLGRALFGSTERHLMRKCPCPVWITKPAQRGPLRRIVAAIDAVPQDETHRGLNEKIMEIASSLADSEKAQLHIVHAWRLYGESIVRGRGRVFAQEVARVVREEAARRRRLLGDLLTAYASVSPQAHLVKGDPGVVIPHMVEELNANLLVMGTVCRTGVPGLLIGNTAERVLDAVNCSVLTVKPDGFISPVRLDDTG